MRVKYFCWDRCSADFDLRKNFIEDDGHIILLSLTRKINEYAEYIDSIVNLINVLEEWKNKDWYTSQTAYQLDFRRSDNKETYTLYQAKKMYKETKIKYDTLYSVFISAAETHYKDMPGKLIDKYFSEHYLNI